MGLFSKDIQSLDDLFRHGLQDLYYAENQITKALPKMIDAATDPMLKTGFEKHLAETENQIKRLEQVFALIEADPSGKKCPAIDGIIAEGNEVMSEVGEADVLNVALVAAAQAVEHYEITRYGALIAWATELGRNDCAMLLNKNLAEEKATDAKLTAMAERRVNPRSTGAREKPRKAGRGQAAKRASRSSARKRTAGSGARKRAKSTRRHA